MEHTHVCVCENGASGSLLSLQWALADSPLNQTALQCWTNLCSHWLSLSLTALSSLSLLIPIILPMRPPINYKSLLPFSCHLELALPPPPTFVSVSAASSLSVSVLPHCLSLCSILHFTSHCSAAAALPWQTAADTMPSQHWHTSTCICTRWQKLCVWTHPNILKCLDKPLCPQAVQQEWCHYLTTSQCQPDLHLDTMTLENITFCL